MATQAQLRAQIESLTAQLSKVQSEYQAVLNPPERTFMVSAVTGIFADDTDVRVGDVCHVIVVRGRVGVLATNGIWGDIAPGTIVEYWVTRGTSSSNHAVEFFIGA